MSSPRDVLLTVLTEAASQEPARMQNAVTQLQQWEATAQFNATLQVGTLGRANGKKANHSHEGRS